MNDMRQQQRPAPAPETRTQSAPTDFEQLLKKDVKTMEYVPFGGRDKIKLTVKIIQELIAVPTRSGKTCSERDALRFMMMCQARGLNPFEGDAFLIGYDGTNGPEFSLITAHQAFLKRAEIHPEYDGMKSGIIVLADDGLTTLEHEGDFHLPGADVVGGWATVFFKNRTVPTTRKIRMARFNKGFAQWKADPAGMICKCAEADALRSSFPTMVGGLYLREEMDFSPEIPSVKRPLFEASPLTASPAVNRLNESEAIQNAPQGEPVPAPEPEPEPEPQVPAPVQQPAGNGKPNYLKGVRGLCAAAKVKEFEVLAFLAETNTTDGSVTSLDELAMTGDVLKLVYDNWSGKNGISTQIIAARKGGDK